MSHFFSFVSIVIVSNLLPLVTIFLATVVVALALDFTFRGRPYLGGFAIAFCACVYHEFVRYYNWEVSELVLSVMFFVAALAALASVVATILLTSKRGK